MFEGEILKKKVRKGVRIRDLRRRILGDYKQMKRDCPNAIFVLDYYEAKGDLDSFKHTGHGALE
jgi:hypothetical protein